MAEPLTLEEAVRFHNAVYKAAAERGQVSSMARWIGVWGANDYNRALRRGLCLTAIPAVYNEPKSIIVFTYRGATEDLYYAAALETFIPAVRSQARLDGLATLASQDVAVGRISLSIGDSQIARRPNAIASKVRRVGDVLGLPVGT